MLRTLRPLLGYRVCATDMPVGFLRDIVFDDETWNIRHLDIHAGHALGGHNVLVPPDAIDGLDWVSKTLRLRMTREDVFNSPPETSDSPIHRQFESAAATFYARAVHWMPLAHYPAPEWEPAPMGNPHLRRVRHLVGYRIENAEGKMGHVVDFIADQAQWHLPLIVIDRRHLWTRKEVMLPSDAVRSFDWDRRALEVGLDTAAIDAAPEFDPLRLQELNAEDIVSRVVT